MLMKETNVLFVCPIFTVNLVMNIVKKIGNSLDCQYRGKNLIICHPLMSKPLQEHRGFGSDQRERIKKWNEG